MTTIFFHHQFSISLAALLSLGLVSSAIPVRADDTQIITEPKPLEVPTGRVGDLKGIETPNRVGDFGGIVGQQEQISFYNNPYQGQKIIVFYPSRQETQPASSLTLEPSPTLIGDLTIDQIVSGMVGQPDRSSIDLYFR